jgi:hypothetical protein
VLPDVVIEGLERRGKEAGRSVRMRAGSPTRYQPQVPLCVVPAGRVSGDQPGEVVDQGGQAEDAGSALAGGLAR